MRENGCDDAIIETYEYIIVQGFCGSVLFNQC
jgi:hypothetical protein